MPHIDAELDEVLNVLHELEVQLPAIRTQAAHLCRLYDSSRDEVPAPLFSHSTLYMLTRLFLPPLRIGPTTGGGPPLVESRL